MKRTFHQLALLPAVVALLVSCGKPERSTAIRPEAGPRAVHVARAELRLMERVLHVVGTLAAHDEATVAAQVAGQIERTFVDIGDRVAAGQELALIDQAAHEALARQAAANLARAMASAANTTQTLKRIQDLTRDNIASASELDLAVAEVERARADVKAAEAAEAIARLNLERSRVKAPFDGAIAERVASVGNYVGIGAPIVRVVQTDPLRLRLEVPERESVAVRAGQEVRVTVEGDSNVYTGRLARIAPAIREANRMLLAEADVPNRGALRAGLFARAQIIVSQREPGVTVPPDAVITFAGMERVVAVKDGKAMERIVTTGRCGSGWVEITSGLAAGEIVVVDPAGIRTGQPLTVENEPETLPANATRTASGQ
jgi:RND family efflux transporter MFP subunit